MGRNIDIRFSKWLYKIGFGLLLTLSVVALVAFMKALCITGLKVEEGGAVHNTDTIQIKTLQREVQDLNSKVDSLLVLSRIVPQKVYKNVVPKKDGCTIEVNIQYKL